MGDALKGRVALVVGAARPPGIGAATAARLARAGAVVVCADTVRDEQLGGTAGAAPGVLESVVDDIADVPGGVVAGRAVDPLDEEAVEALVRWVVDEHGSLDVCCNLVGATGPNHGDGGMMSIPVADWRRGIEWNLTACFLIARAAARVMSAAGGGTIVNLSSHAAGEATPGVGCVGAARAGVEQLTAVLARELGGHGVRVNAVAPLRVVSEDPRFPNPGLVTLQQRVGDAAMDQAVGLGRPQTPDETAAVVEFLCGPGASFVSGVTVPVAGGPR